MCEPNSERRRGCARWLLRRYQPRPPVFANLWFAKSQRRVLLPGRSCALRRGCAGRVDRLVLIPIKPRCRDPRPVLSPGTRRVPRPVTDILPHRAAFLTPTPIICLQKLCRWTLLRSTLVSSTSTQTVGVGTGVPFGYIVTAAHTRKFFSRDVCPAAPPQLLCRRRGRPRLPRTWSGPVGPAAAQEGGGTGAVTRRAL